MAANPPRSTDKNEPSHDFMSTAQKAGLSLYFALLGLAFSGAVVLAGWVWAFTSKEINLLLITLFAGGLGALVQSVGSFVTYAGERKLYASWAWWYALRPIMGAGLALIFYFAFRGSFVVLSTSPEATNADKINAFGVAMIAGLVGMFSKEATDKLKEIAEGIFKKEERSDSLVGATTTGKGTAKAEGATVPPKKPR